jgi:hypothetical protein
MNGLSAGARSDQPRPLAASSTVNVAWSGNSRLSSTAANVGVTQPASSAVSALRAT